VHAFLRAHFCTAAGQPVDLAAAAAAGGAHEGANAKVAARDGGSSELEAGAGGPEAARLVVPAWVEDALAAAGCDWRAAEPEWTPVADEELPGGEEA
jgi:hypothetical protein